MKINYKIITVLSIMTIVLGLVTIKYIDDYKTVKAYKNEVNLHEVGMSASTIKEKDIKIIKGKDVITTTTFFNTVGRVLDSLEIELDENDKISHDNDDYVTDGMQIDIIKVEKRVINEESVIAFKTITKYNEKLEIGKSKVISNGSNGLKNITKQLEYENDDLVKETVIDEYISKEPVNKVIEKGTKNYFISSRGKTTFNKSLVMNATAYDLSYESTGKNPGDKYYGITASGTKVRPGVVAVDPRVIPLGTKLYIKGYGFFTAEDTGGAIKGKKIDIFMESRKKALDFGRKSVKVYILK